LATVSSQTPSGKGKLPKAITSILPLGSIFYPKETVDFEELDFDVEELKKLKLEILEELKENFHDIGLNIFKKIQIPPWFTIDIVNDKWTNMINRIFNEAIIKTKNSKELTDEDRLLLDQLKLNRAIEIAINTNKKTILKRLIDNYKNHISDSFNLIEETLYSIRRNYGKIFLDSNLSPKFMTYISKTINVIISYFYYLKSELNSVLSELRHILTGRGSIDHFKKDTKAIFARILILDLKQLDLLIKMIELDIFMDMWSSETVEELFESKKIYNSKNLDNEYFYKILNDLNKNSMDMHIELIKISKERKKDFPFTFSNNFDIKDQEKMELISRIIYST